MGLDSGYIDTELKTLSLRVNRETSTNQQVLVDLIRLLAKTKAISMPYNPDHLPRASRGSPDSSYTLGILVSKRPVSQLVVLKTRG